MCWLGHCEIVCVCVFDCLFVCRSKPGTPLTWTDWRRGTLEERAFVSLNMFHLLVVSQLLFSEASFIGACCKFLDVRETTSRITCFLL